MRLMLFGLWRKVVKIEKGRKILMLEGGSLVKKRSNLINNCLCYSLFFGVYMLVCLLFNFVMLGSFVG